MIRVASARARCWGPPLLLLALLALGGCHRQLMRAPVIFDQTGADPFAALPAERRQTQATIFYATNRRATPESDAEPYGRSRAPALVLGRLTARIGDDTPWRTLVDKTLGPLDTARPKMHLEDAREFGPLLTTAPPRVVVAETGGDRDAAQIRFTPRLGPGRGAFRFAEALNAEMKATGCDEVYVYVHGYRNSFSDALDTASSLHHYNGRRGAVVAFSWPSQRHLFDYLEDRESATFAVGDFRALLVFLADHTQAQRIHIIAHSMGTFLTSNTLREMRLLGFDQSPEQLRDRFRIDNVVLVAPDIDVDVLQKRFFREGFHHVPRKMTIYTSPDDKALAWARRLLFGTERAGSVTGANLSETQRLWLQAHPDVAMIDITGQKTFGLGHSHHTENPGVASDLLLMLAHDFSPPQRGLVQSPQTSVWRFPKGYTEAVRQIAQSVYPPRLPATAAVRGASLNPPPPQPSPAGATAAP